MGGLVAKSMLTRLNHGDDVSRLRKIKAVVFLATPAQGADLASIGAWISLNPQLGNMEKAHLNAFIQSLEDQWVQLMEDRIKTKEMFPLAYCAYETLKTGLWLVVPRELAASRCDEPLYPMPFNHSDMAQPTSVENDPYLWVMGKIQEAGTTGVKRRRAEELRRTASKASMKGEYAVGRQAFDRALRIYNELGDQRGQAHVLRGLGDLERHLGRYDDSRELLIQSRTLYRSLGDYLGQADVLWVLPRFHGHLG